MTAMVVCEELSSVLEAKSDAVVTRIPLISDGDRLEFRDFGVFGVVKRKQKIGRNPKNASVPIIIPERRAVKFTPGKKMKGLIDTEEQQGAAL